MEIAVRACGLDVGWTTVAPVAVLPSLGKCWEDVRMVEATRMVRGSALLGLALAGALAACGDAGGPQPDDGGGASPDAAPADVAVAQPADGAGATFDVAIIDGAGAKLDVPTVDVGIVRPDAQGAAGAPLVPCSGDPAVLLWDAGYVCGTCDNDAYFAVVCRDGFLACPTSFVTRAGELVTVPSSVYVIDKNDYGMASGQCAYGHPPTSRG